MGKDLKKEIKDPKRKNEEERGKAVAQDEGVCSTRHQNRPPNLGEEKSEERRKGDSKESKKNSQHEGTSSSVHRRPDRAIYRAPSLVDQHEDNGKGKKVDCAKGVAVSAKPRQDERGSSSRPLKKNEECGKGVAVSAKPRQDEKDSSSRPLKKNEECGKGVAVSAKPRQDERGSSSRPLKKNEECGKWGAVAPKLSLYQAIQEKGQTVSISQRKWFKFPNEDMVYYTCQFLDKDVRQWLIGAGEAMAFRAIICGLHLPCTSKDIIVVDNQIRLPDPSDNSSSTMDLREIIRSHWSLCLEVLGHSQNQTADMRQLGDCFMYLLSDDTGEAKRLALFKQLLAQYVLVSDYTKLTFIEHSMHYLSQSTLCLDVYFKYRGDKFYDIEGIVHGNQLCMSVYRYFQGRGHFSSAAWRHYKDMSYSVLLFITNFIKHSDQHCKQLDIPEFPDEDKVAMLELYFTEEIHQLLLYSWKSKLVIDRNGFVRIAQDFEID